MTSSIISPLSDSQYKITLERLEKGLDAFELAMKLIDYAYTHDLEGAKAMINAAPSGLLLEFILSTYAYRTSEFQRKYLIDGTNPYSDLFFEIWLLYDQNSSELKIEINEEESFVPEKLVEKYKTNCLHLTHNALKKLVNRKDPVLIQKLFSRLAPAEKAIAIDLMDEVPFELIPKIEIVEIIEELEKGLSNKTVRLISALPEDLFYRLAFLQIPLKSILSRCLFIPDLIRLKKMGEKKELFLIKSVPFDESGRPFKKVLYTSLNKTDIKNYPPILLIICLNHRIPLDPILPYLSISTTDIYAQIPFIAAFGSYESVFEIYKYYERHRLDIPLYTLLKGLDISRRSTDDSLSLEDVSSDINHKIKKYAEKLLNYYNLFKSRDLKKRWSLEDIEKLEEYHDLNSYIDSIHFDALIAPFYSFRAKILLTEEVATLERICVASKKQLKSLMQYENKEAFGVFSKGRKGKSKTRTPIIWKEPLNRI